MNGVEHPSVSPFNADILTSDGVGNDDLAAPAVAGLAAYFMSLDQYRQQIQVPGSVARNVRDLIRSLAYARSPLQPVVAWNGIDSRQIQCPVRRDAGSSGCPVRNTTSVIPPQSPPSQGPKSISSSSSPFSTIAVIPPQSPPSQGPKSTPGSSSSFSTIAVSSNTGATLSSIFTTNSSTLFDLTTSESRHTRVLSR